MRCQCKFMNIGLCVCVRTRARVRGFCASRRRMKEKSNNSFQLNALTSHFIILAACGLADNIRCIIVLGGVQEEVTEENY